MLSDRTYGQKGGEGPTRGKTATTFDVTLPDGSTSRKRTFGEYSNPVAYAYQYNGQWFVAGISEANDSSFSAAHTQCPVSRRGGGDQ